ncbi:MAG: hypothetical protein U1F58_08535 [Burkholderiales bacterium]
MSPSHRRHLQFVAISLVACVPAVLGFPILARMKYRNQDLAQSAADVVGGMHRLNLLEALPFLLLGIVCASLACQSLARGAALLVLGLASFTAIYYFGSMGAEALMARRAWTAASITGASIPFKCLGVLALIVIARAVLDRPDGRTKA